MGCCLIKISVHFSDMAKIWGLDMSSENYPKSVPDIKKTPVSVPEQ